MVKHSDSKDSSPLEKWRRQKDKIFEADAVESDDLTVGATSGSRKSSTFPRVSATNRGGSGDLKFIPIQAPPPKGEATMIPGQRRRKSAEPTLMPIPAPPP
ncbi:MAG: hypothetical protein O3A85_15105, partial [Proteobacteria bacterium]|nr:hypothetical protein [Pseudomonadota bacterium]